MTTYDAGDDRTRLPVSATLAWWATAWLRGHVVTDLLLDALAGDDRLHRLADGATLPVVLGGWRAAGATEVGLALPVEGDPLGLGGPPSLNTLALELGEAVVCSRAGAALVPEVSTETVTWHELPAERRQLPDVGEADRDLRGQLIAAADGLAALDVARWRPEAADLFLDRRRPAPAAPPGVPARCVDLAGRALTAVAIADLALDDDGGAVSASEAQARQAVLLPLERAARRALVAACSPEVWPPA
ncbi:hypothetical protein GCM10009623_38360 [Nocardioides aestuarii]|uniref:Uncharacterized protein n=1 Tax=Nocardioides aestuarii TaxID=252231 RepID=A0ABW4TS52_9ACTN